MTIGEGDLLLGKYRVERVLGQGGMGVVLAARHLELGELFAIKLLLPHALPDVGAVERFIREARASARLKGEHVVKVHDVGRTEEGAPYMVMEHLAGTDLQGLLRMRGPLPVEEAVTYMMQVCEAVAEAHSLGIVHRDLKPANMFFIRLPNGLPCVKVIDFGISKQVVPGGGVAHDLTQDGIVLGSPCYMSPEQMQGGIVDPRGDIWALGAVLFELLTGRQPFNAATLPELCAKVMQEAPPSPSQLCTGIPPELDPIVLKCLEKRPENRFQTVAELMNELGAVGAASPTATAPRSPASRPAEASARASDIVTPDPVSRSVSPAKAGKRPAIRVMVLALVAGAAIGGTTLIMRGRAVTHPAPTPGPSATEAPPSPPVTASGSKRVTSKKWWNDLP